MVKSYYKLLQEYPRYLTYGIFHSFFSSFGQTFAVALFIPSIQKSLKLNHGKFGLLYAFATIGSAFFLPFIGKYLDQWNLKKFSVMTASMLALACSLIAISTHPITLFIGLLLIRLSGQSLLSLTAVTSASRYFTKQRGKALAIATCGHSLGEGFLPLMITGCLAIWSWQTVYFQLAGACIFIFIPCVLFLVKNDDPFVLASKKKQPHEESQSSNDYSRKDVLKSPFFYFVIPGFLLPPFLLTGLFFHQAVIAEERNWPLEWIATCFISFAVFRVLGSFLAGPLIDKTSAKKIFSFILIPFVFGLLTLLLSSHKISAFMYLGFVGFTIGMATSTQAALWAEIFGKTHLGAIKSMTTPLIILSTAIAPPIFGFLFDNNISLESLLTGSIITAVVCIVFSFLSLNIKMSEVDS